MKSGLAYDLKTVQNLALSPSLLQSIKILAMSRMELEDLLTHELEENPLLDEAEPSSNLSGLSEFYDVAAPQPNIQEYLASQLAELQLDEEDKAIALELIGNVNDDGYLDISLSEFAKTQGIEVHRCERMLDQIQHLEPAGIAARDLRECLLLQLESLHLEDTMAARIVRDFLAEMQAHKYKRIAAALGASEDEVIQNVMAIKVLNPSPACNLGQSNISFAMPDAYVLKNGEEWELSLNNSLPKVCVSELHKQTYVSPDSGVPKDYLNAKLKSASLLIHALEERQKTILEVAEVIIEKQKAFLDKGLQALVPMKMSDVASKLGIHESTVSRAVNNKYLATPHGTIEMKRFFSSGLLSRGNEAVASESVRQKLVELVRSENKHAPLSDQRIAEAFSKEGIEVARRTVAKYRDQLGILPASTRRAA